jgi:hypothetical protein
MSLAVRERTNEIGAMKAIGFTDGHIMTLILAESVTLSALAGFIGLGLAWTFGKFFAPTGGFLPVFYFAPTDIALGAALAIALGPDRRRHAGVNGHAAEDHRRSEEDIAMRSIKQAITVTLVSLYTIPQAPQLGRRRHRRHHGRRRRLRGGVVDRRRVQEGHDQRGQDRPRDRHAQRRRLGNVERPVRR